MPDVDERVTARGDGVEWDIVLAARPAGVGDLTVRADLEGLSPGAAPVRSARTWSIPVAGGSVTIDELVAIDATGKEVYRALPRIAGDRLLLTVPAEVLDGAAYPLTIDPTVSPERHVSPVVAPDDQRFAAMAFDGTNYLVVWQGNQVGIVGARVTPGGVVLDPNGLSISGLIPSAEDPVVAFDGTNFLVVWSHGGDVKAQRMSKTGVAVGSTITVSAAAGSQSEPAVTFNGNSYLVAWEDTRFGSIDIVGARVSPSGSVLDPVGLALESAPGGQREPAVAFDGTNSFVVWKDFRSGIADIFGARVGPGGVIDTASIPISTATAAQSQPALAFDGTNYLVAWADARSGSGQDIWGARVGTAGNVLNPTGFAISTATDDQLVPAVAHDGASHFVVWEDERNGSADLFGTRVTNAGAVVTPAGTPVATIGDPSARPSAATGGGGFFVAWADFRFSFDADIFGSRISAAGAVLDPNGILLSTATTTAQVNAAAAFDGTNFLVVWQDARSGEADIYASRVAPSGRVLDPGGIVVSGAAGGQLSPAVAFDGTNFFVVWADIRTGGYDIYGSRVSKAGAVLDPAGIPVSASAGPQDIPSVAWNGTRYLVVWQDIRTGIDDAFASRVTAAGVVQDPAGIKVSSPTGTAERFPTVASNGSGFLVAWGDERTPATAPDLWAARVSDAGAVLDPTGFAVSVASGFQTASSLAYDGTNYLATWADGRSGNQDIYGTRISSAGAVLDGVTTGKPISTAPGDQSFPEVAFNGSYLVAWIDRRNGSIDQIYGARVATDGTVQDPSGFVISTAAGDHGYPEVAPGSGSDWGVVYDRADTGIYLRGVNPK
jgi:hypothetical protein